MLVGLACFLGEEADCQSGEVLFLRWYSCGLARFFSIFFAPVFALEEVFEKLFENCYFRR